MCVRTCGLGCSMRPTRMLQPLDFMHRLLPAALNVKFMSSADANSREKSRVSQGPCLITAPTALSKLSSELALTPTRCKVCSIQSMAPSSIIFSWRARRSDKRCSTARQCICTGDAKGSKSSIAMSVSMQPGFCTSADSISFRPMASHEHTASTASESSLSAASPPALMAGNRSARAFGPPKQANAAKKVRRGRSGSSGQASLRSTAQRTACTGGNGSCFSFPSTTAVTALPWASVSPLMTVVIWPKSRAGGTGSGAVAVLARDSKLLALESRF
mmetsp:Transcript_8322/g.18625  ORF Transcript_8322/g.18625 Transcript_8322/m.18625 type:complete len:274 (-) Transcript_8322:1536-2357(-)